MDKNPLPPPHIQAFLWQATVEEGAHLLRLWQQKYPATPMEKLKTLEALYCYFAHQVTLDAIEKFPPDQWTPKAKEWTEPFEKLLWSLLDDAAGYLLNSICDAVAKKKDYGKKAIERKKQFLRELTKRYPDPFFDPLIDIVVEVDYKWYLLHVEEEPEVCDRALKAYRDSLKGFWATATGALQDVGRAIHTFKDMQRRSKRQWN